MRLHKVYYNTTTAYLKFIKKQFLSRQIFMTTRLYTQTSHGPQQLTWAGYISVN